MDDDLLDEEEEMMMTHNAQQDGHVQGYVLHNSNTYSPAQWAAVKASLGRRKMGLRVIRVSDSVAQNPAKRNWSGVEVFQTIVGSLELAGITAVTLFVIWVMYRYHIY